MSHMTENQRAQYARPELSVASTGVNVRSTRGLVIYTIVAVVVLGALCYATVQALEGGRCSWCSPGIVVTAVGGGIAVLHGRRTHETLCLVTACEARRAPSPGPSRQVLCARGARPRRPPSRPPSRPPRSASRPPRGAAR